MKQIINVLLVYIQIQYHIICYLMTLLFSKDFMPKDEVPISKKYHHLQIDYLPIIEVLEKLDYQELLIEYQQEHGKALKPINRRNAKCKVPESMICPRCGAPHIYLYDNTGGRGQYLCKICKTNFNDKNRLVDMFSRLIVSYEVWETEKAEYAQRLIKKATLSQSIAGKPLVLHYFHYPRYLFTCRY